MRLPAVAALLFFLAPLGASAQVTTDQAPAPAHVSYVEGAVLIERDGRTDDAPANMPLLAGDRVRTRSGRAEVLFGDGSTLRLDANTTVDFQSDSLIRVLEGRIRLSIPGPRRAVGYRADTPSIRRSRSRRRSMDGQPVRKTERGSSPMRMMFAALRSVAGKWRCASLVTACRTLSSIDPVTSPPCVWASGMFM